MKIGIGHIVFVLLPWSGPAPLVQARIPVVPQNALAADQRVIWLTRNAVVIRTLDPEDRDFRDLMPLKQSLGGARIVMLGESSHGEGATALGKTRMVKFLHEEMGFDVLVFEGGIYDMTKVWDSLRNGDASLAALKQGVMPAWAGSDQSQHVFDYLAANGRGKRPMEIAGFDSQVTGSGSRQFFVRDLAEFLEQSDVTSPLVHDGTRARAILDEVMAGSYWRGTPVPSAADQESYLRDLQQLENDLSRTPAGAEQWRKGFWIQALRSLQVSSKGIWSAQSKDKARRTDVDEERERQGAENLLWLAAERYAGRKIVVWGATSHLFRNTGLDASQCEKPTDTEYCSRIPMGQRVREKLGRDVYVIGFTAYGGNTGFMVGGKPAESWTGPLTQNQHPSVEMEELLNATGFDYAFVDLHAAGKDADWLKAPIWSRPLGNEAGLRTWSEALDALFFIREQQYDTRKSF